MKKLILMLFAVVATATATKAQVVSMGPADTITNADTASKYRSINATIISQGSATEVSIQVIINRLSGTAAGTAIVYGAITNGDTTMYVPVDTFTFTNVATQSHIFSYPDGEYSHYRVLYTSSGTTVLRCRAWMYARKEN